jgi:hypothetical protein
MKVDDRRASEAGVERHLARRTGLLGSPQDGVTIVFTFSMSACSSSGGRLDLRIALK